MERGEMVGVDTLRGSSAQFGSGDGYGYGSGDGYGSGSGSGDGFGCYGSGDGVYWRCVMPVLTKDWTTDQREKFLQLVDAKSHLAFWRSNAKGLPANGGELDTPAAPGVIHREKGPLSLCERGTLHATLIPPKWKGERIWIVALHGDVIGDEDKFGCLEREILGEACFE